MRGVYTNKRILDKGELTQLMIIIAGLAIAAVVTIGAIASVALNKGEAAAGCISDSSVFKSGHATKVRCEDYDETAKEKSKAVISGSFSNPTASGDIIEKDEEVKKQESMKQDLKNFYDVLENYKKEHGVYPSPGSANLRPLKFEVNTDNYPSEEYNWNFEYCPSLDNKEFVQVTYAGNGKIYYVSSNNKNPREAFLQKDEQLPFKRDGKETGGVISPCYSGTPYSIADKVGLGQVGEFNEKGDELIGGIGSTGINHTGGNGFAQNHK